MRKDIETIEDIQLLVDTFYGKVQEDQVIGHIFHDVAQVNWDKHLPVMYSFWETVLMGKVSFKGNPIAKHLVLNQRTPLKEEHFNQWLHLWHTTVDELFEGKMAESAKSKAQLMKTLMLTKVQNDGGIPIVPAPHG